MEDSDPFTDVKQQFAGLHTILYSKYIIPGYPKPEAQPFEGNDSRIIRLSPFSYFTRPRLQLIDWTYSIFYRIVV